jgi:lipoyl(octanoyl) transferase
MSGWRLILHAGTPAPGAANMAVDHALLESVQQGAAPVLRLYAWEPACLSFGRNQHAAGTYDEHAIRAAGLHAVRRPTGGLAVLHHHELTYAVIAPADPLGGPRAAYRRINEALVDGLRRLGVPAALAGAAPAPSPLHDTASPCFQAPAPGEVVAAGRKLVGSAQRCERRVLLQHGSILLGGSQQRVTRFLAPPAWREPDGPRSAARVAGSATTVAAPVAAAASGSVTLRELMGEAPPVTEVAEAVAAGFDAVFGTRLALSRLSSKEEVGSARLEAMYSSDDWTWLR